jgi:hypothetical protein
VKLEKMGIPKTKLGGPGRHGSAEPGKAARAGGNGCKERRSLTRGKCCYNWLVPDRWYPGSIVPLGY